MALLRLLSSPSHLHFPNSSSSSSSPTLLFHHQLPTSSILSPSSSSSFTISCNFSPIKSPLTPSRCSSSSSEYQTEEEEEEEGSGTRILAQNVPWTATADDLLPLFQKYGTVVDIEVAMYNKTKSRGLVFVTMGSNEEAKAVLENLEAYELEGRPLRIAWAKPKTEKPSPPSPPKFKPMPVHNLFVANLHFEARSNDLMEFFKDNGANVVSAEVIFHDNPRRSAGYGFVSFNTKAEADAALSSFQEKEFMGRPLRVAQSKRFLREATKKNLASQEQPSELISVAE